MNKTTREIIKEEIEKLKSNKNKKYYFCISLTFDAIKFNEYFKDYKNFWHLLTKSFFGPKNMSPNNEWYNNLEPEGFYFFTESYNLVQFRVYLETNKKIKYEELIKRVNDIVPIKELELYHNNEYEFNKMFANDIFTIQKSEIQYIGKLASQNLDDEELPF